MGSAALRATQSRWVHGWHMAHDGCIRGSVSVRRLGCYGETVAASHPSGAQRALGLILRVTTHAAARWRCLNCSGRGAVPLVPLQGDGRVDARSERLARAYVPEVEHAELGLSRMLHGRLVACRSYCGVRRTSREAGACRNEWTDFFEDLSL
jgi:hypothetical protein